MSEKKIELQKTMLRPNSSIFSQDPRSYLREIIQHLPTSHKTPWLLRESREDGSVTVMLLVQPEAINIRFTFINTQWYSDEECNFVKKDRPGIILKITKSSEKIIRALPTLFEQLTRQNKWLQTLSLDELQLPKNPNQCSVRYPYKHLENPSSDSLQKSSLLHNGLFKEQLTSELPLVKIEKSSHYSSISQPQLNKKSNTNCVIIRPDPTFVRGDYIFKADHNYCSRLLQSMQSMIVKDSKIWLIRESACQGSITIMFLKSRGNVEAKRYLLNRNKWVFDNNNPPSQSNITHMEKNPEKIISALPALLTQLAEDDQDFASASSFVPAMKTIELSSYFNPNISKTESSEHQDVRFYISSDDLPLNLEDFTNSYIMTAVQSGRFWFLGALQTFYTNELYLINSENQPHKMKVSQKTLDNRPKNSGHTEIEAEVLDLIKTRFLWLTSRVRSVWIFFNTKEKADWQEFVDHCNLATSTIPKYEIYKDKFSTPMAFNISIEALKKLLEPMEDIPAYTNEKTCNMN